MNKLWFTDIIIEKKHDFFGYTPVVEDQEGKYKFSDFGNYISEKFGEMHSIVFKKSEVENPCLFKLNQWINGREMQFLCKFSMIDQERVSTSIYVSEKQFSKSKNLDLEYLKNHLHKLLN